VSTGPLDGQVAAVTGAASGIGRATVHALARAGARIAIIDRAADGAARVAEEVAQTSTQATAFVADLADRDAIVPLVDAVLAELRRIDILVNSAGISAAPHNALDFSNETYDVVMNVYLRAPFLLIQAVGNHMIERGGGGRIVNISSSAAFRPAPSPAVYAASKAGINGLTRAAAADLGLHDINVNSVAPGLTKTPMTAGLGDDVYQQVVSWGPLENLLHRPSEAEDVANVILFLCLPEAGRSRARSSTPVPATSSDRWTPPDPHLQGSRRVREVFARPKRRCQRGRPVCRRRHRRLRRRRTG
jgi:NAD(P)-dependent dehydrogenase (short-subunit alcohol dehydrogenase family)